MVELVTMMLPLVLLLGMVGTMVGTSSRQTQKLTAQMALQQSSRKALVQLLREVQEGMEVLQPAPGSTQAWALVRDRASRVRWFYQKRQGGTTDRTELWRVIDDPSRPLAQRHEMLLRDIRRLTFTCRTEGALQMNVLLAEDDREYALLTTVRLRNLAAAEELW